MVVMNNKEKGIHDSVFRVGVVSSVDGREVKVRMDRNKNSSHLMYKGTLINRGFKNEVQQLPAPAGAGGGPI